MRPHQMRGTPLAAQGRRGTGEVAGTSKYSCSLCRIEYHIADGKNPVCPVCDLRTENDSLRAQIFSLAQEASMLRDDLRRAKNESSVIETMRDAFMVADPEDVAQIKSIAYRWRDDPERTTVMPVRLSGAENGQRRMAIEVRSRHGEADYFVPTSVGGVVFVQSYGDLTKARGNVRAMEQFAQAIAGNLAS